MAIKEVQCLVCNEKIRYEDDDTGVLINHLNYKHSGADVFRFLSGANRSVQKEKKIEFSAKKRMPLIEQTIQRDASAIKPNANKTDSSKMHVVWQHSRHQNLVSNDILWGKSTETAANTLRKSISENLEESNNTPGLGEDERRRRYNLLFVKMQNKKLKRGLSSSCPHLDIIINYDRPNYDLELKTIYHYKNAYGQEEDIIKNKRKETSQRRKDQATSIPSFEITRRAKYNSSCRSKNSKTAKGINYSISIKNKMHPSTRHQPNKHTDQTSVSSMSQRSRVQQQRWHDHVTKDDSNECRHRTLKAHSFENVNGCCHRAHATRCHHYCTVPCSIHSQFCLERHANSWAPQDPIECKHCGRRGRPTIKRGSKLPPGLFGFIWCCPHWPCGSNSGYIVQLHCANCGKQYGCYDIAKKTMTKTC